MYARARSSRGFTLLELVISFAIFSAVILGAMGLLKNQADVIGTVTDNQMTVFPAESAMSRIRRELQSVTQAPNVTQAMAPWYAVTTGTSQWTGTAFTSPYSSLVWRPVIGIPQSGSAQYASYFNNPSLWTGCVSNGILYANVAKVLWVDTSTYSPINVLKLDTIAGSGAAHTGFPDSASVAPLITTTTYTMPTGMVLLNSEILCGNVNTKQSVTAFRLFNALNNTTKFAWTSTGTLNTTYPGGPNPANNAPNPPYSAIGVYLRLERLDLQHASNASDYNTNAGQMKVAQTRSSNYDNSSSSAGAAGYGINGWPDYTDLHTVIQIQGETLTTTTNAPYTGG